MRVRIDPAVMASPERHARDLDAILDSFDTGQHQWVIEDPEVVLSSRWVAEGASWGAALVQELVAKTWRAAIDEVEAQRPNLRLVLVVAQAAAEPDLSPGRAREILAAPAYVVVEDATSDVHFLRAMAVAFDAASVLEALDRVWLLPEHGGGSGILKRIDALLARGIVPWRILVLADSDRLVPGPLPKKVADLVDALLARGVKPIVLYKREIENYLPDTLIDDRKHHDAYVSLCSLMREQRDHYDMKYGFKMDRATEEVELGEQRELFAGCNPWHLRRLAGGFGKNIGARLEGAALTRGEMDAVCETFPGEIEGILRVLEEML